MRYFFLVLTVPATTLPKKRLNRLMSIENLSVSLENLSKLAREKKLSRMTGKFLVKQMSSKNFSMAPGILVSAYTEKNPSYYSVQLPNMQRLLTAPFANSVRIMNVLLGKKNHDFHSPIPEMTEKSVFREAWSPELTSQSFPVSCFWCRGFVPHRK